MIKISNLFKSYGKIDALYDVSIRFDAGQCVALIGPNGSGKTTLMKSILQIVRPDSGSVTINDIGIVGDETHRKQIGYLPQINRLPEHMKVRQLFSLIARIRKDHSSIDTTLYDQLGVKAYADRPLGTLSEGMRQQVNAALAFYFDPMMLILDEPTASLDPVSSDKLRKKITDSLGRGRLVLISSHVLSELDDLATHVAYLMNGRLVFFREIEALRSETGEHRLSRIVPVLLEKEEVYHD